MASFEGRRTGTTSAHVWNADRSAAMWNSTYFLDMARSFTMEVFSNSFPLLLVAEAVHAIHLGLYFEFVGKTVSEIYPPSPTNYWRAAALLRLLVYYCLYWLHRNSQLASMSEGLSPIDNQGTCPVPCSKNPDLRAREISLTIHIKWYQ